MKIVNSLIAPIQMKAQTQPFANMDRNDECETQTQAFSYMMQSKKNPYEVESQQTFVVDYYA